MKSRSTEPLTKQQAYQYALRLLTGRDYSVAGMRVKLGARCVCEEDVEVLIHQLQGEGWVDDRRYAVRFAESAVKEGRFFGPRLRMEMRRKGFDAGLVNEIMGSLLSESDEVAEVRAVASRRYPGFSFSTATDRDKRRVISFLQRRGFGISSIMQALRTVEESLLTF